MTHEGLSRKGTVVSGDDKYDCVSVTIPIPLASEARPCYRTASQVWSCPGLPAHVAMVTQV